MGTAIVVAILVVICIYGVISYRKKLTEGCCGGGGDSVKKVKASDRDASHYPYTVVIGVEGMTCSKCQIRVENAFNTQEGMWGEVDLSKHQVTVHMKTKHEESMLKGLIEKAGYMPLKAEWK